MRDILEAIRALSRPDRLRLAEQLSEAGQMHPGGRRRGSWPSRPRRCIMARHHVDAALRVLEDQLQQHRYLVDDRFSLADIALYAYVHCAEEGGFDLEPFTALRAWFDRIEARPSYIPIDEVPR